MTGAILRRVREHSTIETVGDDSERRVRLWFATGTKDSQGEITKPEAFKEKMDWFIRPVSEGGHGGPMLVNHTNKVIGHWDKWGVGIHPKTGNDANWIEGTVHRGPNGGEFPTADKAWNKAKIGLKGGSWGAYVKTETIETDLDKMVETVFNDDVYPFEVSLVMDFGDGAAVMADPNATPIFVNEKAKAQDVNVMTEDVKTEEVKTETPAPEPEKAKVEEVKVVEQVKVPEFVLASDFEKFKAEIKSLLTPPAKPEEVNIDEKIKALVEDKMKAFVEKVSTPLPPADKAKAEEAKSDPDKLKIKDHGAFNKLPLNKRLDILAQEA